MSDPFLFQKGTVGLLPACEEASQWLMRKKPGSTILVEAVEPRNGKFFKKWWALAKTGYDYWSEALPTIEYKGQKVLPNFGRFRKDLIILAGFYSATVNIKGEVRIEHESLKWGSMSEERFTELYDATLRVLLRMVFNGKLCPKWSEEQLRQVVEDIQAFAA